MVAMTVALSILVFASIWFPHRVFGPPIKALALPDENRTVCAGSYEIQYFDYKINRPGIVSAAEVIYDKATGAPIGSGQLVFGPIPFEEATEAHRVPLGWDVPELPPGEYYSIMGIYHENVESKPEFVRFDFRVVECNEDGIPLTERERQ